MSSHRPRLVALLASAALALTGLAATLTPASAADDSTVAVQLLSFTDLHGQLYPGSGADGTVTSSDGTSLTVGGVAYLATHLDQLRQGHQNSILFSTGDNFSGWPKSTWSAQDEPTIEAMNRLGVAFSAVGNHELDVSRSFLVDHMVHGRCFGRIGLDSCFTDSSGKRFHGSDFPYLSGNIVTAKGHRHILPASIIKRVSVPGSKRTLPVGFINVTVPSTQDGVNLERSYNPTLDSTPIVQTANTEAARLTRAGVRAIVLNVHQGASTKGGYDECADVTGPMIDANATLSPAIDAIVTGHYHNAFVCTLDDPSGNPRPVVEAGNAGRLINEIDLELDPSTGEVLRDRTRAVNHPVTQDVAPDPRMQQLVDYWVDANDHTRGLPVARIAADVTSVHTKAGESALGNLIADAYQSDANSTKGNRSDLALFLTRTGPTFGSDLTVAPGEEKNDQPGVITAGDSWNTLEYASNIITVTLTGTELLTLLENQWQTGDDGEVTFTPFAVSRSLHYAFNASKAQGERIDRGSTTVSGKQLRPSGRYRVTLPVRTAFGIDNFPGVDTIRQPVRNSRMRDAFRWYLQRLGTVRPPATDRVAASGLTPIDVDGSALLSDLPWVMASSAWNGVHRDTEVGGGPMRIAGTTYAHGIGVNAPGEVTFYLGGRCSRVTAVAGLDDHVKDYDTGATARFQVYGDGTSLYDSGVTRPGTALAIDVDVTGVDTLTLRANDAGDGSYGDRSDWAQPTVTCSS